MTKPDCICFDGIYENTIEEFMLKWNNLNQNNKYGYLQSENR